MQKSTETPLGWDDVRYFLELARQGKLTATARVLGVEHSTVARRVSALEAQLGLRLFDRLPKSWVLTSEGEGLLGYARRIEEEALAFSRAGAGYGALRGTVRVSAPPVFTSAFLAPRLALARERWPGISIELIGEPRQANLYRREADLALRLSRPHEEGLAARRLGQMGYALYGATPWASKPEAAWEFVGYDELLRETPQQRWLEQLAAGRPFRMRTNDLATMWMACRGGLGLAALPHFLARGDDTLARFDQHPCPVHREVWLAVHPDVRRSPRVKMVADLVAELIQGEEALLA
ncbi:LysR family transcriptional regulator [Massilia solisilvae]|uniref:LysR family transcriptional regulator n=1 Tax=Massilia solisilvae TaxID=1811225 RepID=A0ABT2BPC6_9BURK|nr:LysR family transcriptional regulator [Massilia solisilvae]